MSKDKWVGQSESVVAQEIVSRWLASLKPEALREIDSVDKTQLSSAIVRELIKAKAQT